MSSINFKEETFEVQKYLTLPNQKLKYFEQQELPPIEKFLVNSIDFALGIMGTIAVILIIIAGFKFLTSGGESEKLDEAKELIKFVAIGLGVAFFSYIIWIFIQALFIQ